jgi:hypothetical protein
MCADECLFWGKSGRTAHITSKTGFVPDHHGNALILTLNGSVLKID